MFNSLSKEQQLAVNTINGPVLVIAGPGSGKTHTLTERVLHLVQDVKVDPSRILVFTFTKVAAEEMNARYRSLVSKNQQICSAYVYFGTFHSFFYATICKKIVNKTYRVMLGNTAFLFVYRYFCFLWTNECERIEKSYAQVIHKRVKMRARAFAERFLESYAKIRNESRTLESLTDQEVSVLFLCQRDIVSKLIEEFEAFKKQHQYLDFEDMQTMFLALLKTDSILLKELQQQYDYILVDEFQDINPIQYEIVKLLAEPQNNLFVVGDEDQAIYAFRGSRPEFFLSFEDDFPLVKKIALTANYRSTSQIVESSKHFIENNTKRYPKQLQSVHLKTSIQPIFYQVASEIDEKNILKDTLCYYKKHGYQYKQMAVLLRTNMQVKRYASILKNNHIAYVYDGRKYLPASSLFHEIKNLLEIKEDINPEKRVNTLLEVLQIPQWLQEQKENRSLNATYRDLMLFIHNLKHFSTLSIIVFYYFRFYLWNNLNLKSIYDLIELIRFCRNSNTVQLFKRNYYEHLLGVTDDYVNISTMHQSKGLEFELVFIPGINKEFLPHPWSVDLEEERRILYVGMTRAKSLLFLSGIGDSTFTSEISKSLKNVHKTF